MKTLSSKLRSFRSRYLPSSLKAKDEALMKEKLSDSLSFHSPDEEEAIQGNIGSNWITGIYPNLCGALALLKVDKMGTWSAEVYDTPRLQVSVGKTDRTHYDEKSMVELIRSLDVPSGTRAYIMQPTNDSISQNRLPAYYEGLGEGLWKGILLASNISVTPVLFKTLKKHFKLSWKRKDGCKSRASELFPLLSSQFVRKKDLDRAMAVLIAAYGQATSVVGDSI